MQTQKKKSLQPPGAFECESSPLVTRAIKKTIREAMTFLASERLPHIYEVDTVRPTGENAEAQA